MRGTVWHAQGLRTRDTWCEYARMCHDTALSHGVRSTSTPTRAAPDMVGEVANTTRKDIRIGMSASALVCHTEKAPNAWHRRGTQKTGNTYNQPNLPNQHTSQTKHQALPKGQPGRRTTSITTAAVHASAQQQPTIITHTRQGHHQNLSANAARCEAQEQYRRAA